MKLFLAALPPAPVRAWLADVASGLLGQLGEHARWVRPDAFHVTVCFYGEVDPARTAECVAQTATLVALPPIALDIGDLGAFPSEAQARVLWVGVQDPKLVLASIAERARLPWVEESELRPHVTLARFPRARSVRTLRDVGVGPRGGWEIRLMQSHRTSLGVRYEQVTGPESGSAESARS